MDKSILENLQRAVSLNPKFAEGHFAIGNIFKAQNNINAALESYQKAVFANPGLEAAYINIVEILLAQGRLNDVAVVCHGALAAKNLNSAFYVQLARMLMEKGVDGGAIVCLQKAISLDSNNAENYARLGHLLFRQNRVSESIEVLRRAVALKPADLKLPLYLAYSYHRIGKLDEAIDCLRQAIAINPDNIEAHIALLATSPYLPGYSREQTFADRAAFGERVESQWRERWPQCSKSNELGKRLRIGFVSGDLNNHPVGFFLESVLHELRSRNAIDIILYPTTAVVDELTHRIRAMAHAWVPAFALSDDDFCERIRNDKIDILVDLSGHTPGNRLLVFAQKPAPVQVTWLGYWETTGLRSIDYILCDRYTVLEEEAPYFFEKLWFLPHTRLCFTLPKEPLAVSPLPALKKGYVTFGCFNNLLKINSRVIALWSRILKRIPSARLLLKGPAFVEKKICEEVMANFSSEGISADRLEFQAGSPLKEYYLAYNAIDIALDPFPFPGGTTSVQGIWMGVPVITLKGDRIISRQGEGILHNIELPDWIADSEEDYVELAVKKSSSLDELAKLRSTLRHKLELSPLSNAEMFAENLEDAFKAMWSQHCK